MSFHFGSFENTGTMNTAQAAQKLVLLARHRAHEFAATPLASILDTIHAVGQLWRPGGRYYSLALDALDTELSFSREMTAFTLDLVTSLCDRSLLSRRLSAEFGDAALVDEFKARGPGVARVKAVPHGVLLHVSAGNVFLGCIDSLLSGFLTKNASILKLSSRNQVFPRLFAESIVEADTKRVLADKFAIVHWAGGLTEVEDAFKSSVDAIIAWGGDEMVKSYRKNLPPGIPLIEHGPKISIQVVFKNAYEAADPGRVAQLLARDIMLWDQAACASPQNLFVQEGIDLAALMAVLGAALDAAPLARGRLDEDEQVELLKERYRARLTSLTEGGRYLEGSSWLLHYDPAPGLRPSALNRSLILKTFKTTQHIVEQIAPYSKVLQSCGYLAASDEKDELLAALAVCGMQRFAPIGSVLEGAIGAPHDGRFALMELTRLVGDEAGSDVLHFINESIRTVPFYNRLYAGAQLTSLAQLKPITGADLSAEPLTTSNELLRPGAYDGYIFSSGGTTGKPKFVFFTTAEFNRTGELLAKGYAAQGLRRGDRCANLFVAGNLWSSFMAIDRALNVAGAVQLPIGGLAEPELILKYLEDFKPRVVFGLPSLLLSLAALSRQKGARIEVPVVCYAGEHLNQLGRALLADVWKTEQCFSAGYASVDAGPIGYQCRFCTGREHHLFSEDLHLEIIDSEAVVTSLARKINPVIHLRTGDQVEWAPAESCGCGSNDPKFILHGRTDGQINIWSCRIQLEEIESGLFLAGIREPVFQVALTDDTITIYLEGASIPGEHAAAIIRASIYKSCKDLKLTHRLDHLDKRLVLQAVAPGALPRVARTGKVRSVVDARKL